MKPPRIATQSDIDRLEGMRYAIKKLSYEDASVYNFFLNIQQVNKAFKIWLNETRRIPLNRASTNVGNSAMDRGSCGSRQYGAAR
jgi:hypothetical protein